MPNSTGKNFIIYLKEKQIKIFCANKILHDKLFYSNETLNILEDNINLLSLPVYIHSADINNLRTWINSIHIDPTDIIIKMLLKFLSL
jgi:hypothetical protein